MNANRPTCNQITGNIDLGRPERNIAVMAYDLGADLTRFPGKLVSDRLSTAFGSIGTLGQAIGWLQSTTTPIAEKSM